MPDKCHLNNCLTDLALVLVFLSRWHFYVVVAEQESGKMLDASGLKKIHLILWDQAIKSTEVSFE